MSEGDIARALLEEHSLRRGRWGVLRITDGSVWFVDLASERARHLTAPASWVIPPGSPHKLRLDGPVRLHIDFFAVGPPEPDG